MEQQKKKRHRVPHVYTEDAVRQCIESIKNGEKTLFAACRFHGIPESTIRYRLSGEWSEKTTKGPPTILLLEEEREIITWLKIMERKGFPVVKQSLLFKVKAFLDSCGRPNPFKDNVPGKLIWLKNLKKIHKAIVYYRKKMVLPIFGSSR